MSLHYFFIFFFFISNIYAYNSTTPKSQTTPQHSPPNHSKLSLLTLNTWGLPIWFPGSHKSYRYPKICSTLTSYDYDIICLQEVFDQKLESKLFEALVKQGYYSLNAFDCSRRVKGIIKMDCEGGLLTWSKHPIFEHKFVQFPLENKMNFEEKTGKKGFTITKIQAPAGLIIVINTHLYAGNSEKSEHFRLRQIQYIETYLQTHNYYNQYPIFLSGDFNAYSGSQQNSKCYNYIINHMNFCETETDQRENSFTYDFKTNVFAATNHPRQKLDHIFYRCKHPDMDIAVSNTLVQFTHEASVSDHNGLSTVFEFVNYFR